MSIESLINTGRRMNNDTLLDRVYIHRRSLVSDGAGGQTTAHVRADKPVPARFSSLSDYDLSATANTTFGAASATVTFEVGTEIFEGDWIESTYDEHGDPVPDGVEGDKWLVTGRITPPSRLAIAVRVLVREL